MAARMQVMGICCLSVMEIEFANVRWVLHFDQYPSARGPDMVASGAQRATNGTLERVIRILDLLVDAPAEGIGVRSSAEVTGLSKSAVQRILQSLTDLDIAEKLSVGRYVAGGRFAQWTASFARSSYSLAAADQVMQEVVRECGESVYLTRYLPAALETVFVHVVESEKQFRYMLPLGLRVPLHAGAAGKAILAQLEDDIIGDLTLTRFTKDTIISKAKLSAELRLIRDRGFAVSRGERIENAAGVAAAYTINGIVVGSITMTVPLQDLDEHRLSVLGNAIMNAAHRISFPPTNKSDKGATGMSR